MAGIDEAGGPRVRPSPAEQTVVPRERDEEAQRAAREADEEHARPRRARDPETGGNLDVEA